MYEIDKFGCWVLPKHDSDLIRAYRYYKFAIICAEELSDELCYEEDERYFNTETYVRWYEAVEKALVIWLYYLGFDIRSSKRRGRVHRYHEEVLENLGHPRNPFFDIFNRPCLLSSLRDDKRIRNAWRHDSLPIQIPYGEWEFLACYLDYVNEILEDALTIFGEERMRIWYPQIHGGANRRDHTNFI